MDEIEILAADPHWSSRFLSEAARLGAILPSELLGELHHIGSTAVPGLAAKPVIDIMVLTPSLAAARGAFVDPLEREGYAFWADNHVHVTDSLETLQRHLAFRDRLRRDPEERRVTRR
jgi:GrpB-like predicted nucleotidyltransferase (UPF0157 family)